MPLSSRARKLLWGKAANRCAICRRLLTEPAANKDREAIIGDEAHIIGEKPGAARYQPLEPALRDGYANRILVCRNHHGQIDQQPVTWSVGRLQRIKIRHERLMAQRTSDGKTEAGSVVTLNLMLTGRQLFHLLDGAEAYSMDYEDFQSDEEREVGRSLLQQAHEWGDMSGMLEIGGKIDAAAALGEELNAAMELGLMLYAAVTPQKMVLGGSAVTLRTATLWLRRAETVAAAAG